MLLIEFTISGTVHYISDQWLGLTHFYDLYIISFTPPQYRIATDYGGYVSFGFGDISLSPDLFSGDWPPPKQCSITAKYTASTEGAAVTLFNCECYQSAFAEENVDYDIYQPKYAIKLLNEGADYDGNTVPYPRAFGVVTHVTPVRVADNAGRPCYHLGGMGTASDTKVVIGLTSASAGAATQIRTSAAHGFSNGNSVSIDGSVNFNGTHVISNVTATTFTIPIAFPTDDSEAVPLRIGARLVGGFAVYDDGVPIQENVVVIGDGTFALTASPVGVVTVSGTGATTTLLAAMTWGQTQLGVGSIVSTNSRGTSPNMAYWATSQMPLIDFLSSICAYFTHYFYIQSNVLTLGDMLLDNGTETITEYDYFTASYNQQRVISQIKATWIMHSAQVGTVNNLDVDRGHYIKDTQNILIESLFTKSSGTADGTTSSKLVDSGATFSADGITIGMLAQNTTDDTYAFVTVVTETALTLDSDIFVSGETYVVGPSYPYGDELSITPYHDSRSEISTAFQNILNVMNKSIGEVRVPISGSLPVPGKKFTWPDTMLVVNTSTYIRARNLTFDFVNDEVLISGEGVIT